jgi:hypothetical protein
VSVSDNRWAHRRGQVTRVIVNVERFTWTKTAE